MSALYDRVSLTIAMSRVRAATPRVSVAVGESKPAPFRFGLRALFVALAAVGIVCALLRSMVQQDSSVFLGIGAFCYGGIIAIPVYAFVGSLMVLSTATTWGQRAGEIFAAVVGAIAWIGFICVTLSKWPQLCMVQSLVVVGVVVWLVRFNWKPEDGPAPENTLRRLRDVKEHCHKDSKNHIND